MRGKKRESKGQARERKKVERENIKKHKPEVYENNKEKERLRNQCRRDCGYFKKVGKMSEEEKGKWRTHWTAQKQKQRKKEKMRDQTVQEAPPNPSISCYEGINAMAGPSEQSLFEIPINGTIHSRQFITGKKIARKNRAIMHAELQKVRKERDLYKRKYHMWKKRFQRLQLKLNKTPVTSKSNQSSQSSALSQSPRKVVGEILASGKDKVFDELYLSQVLQGQLRKNSRKCKSLAEKRFFAKHVGGRVVKRYRLEKELDRRKISSYHLRKKWGCRETSFPSKLKRSSKFQNYKSTMQRFFEDDDTSVMTPGKKQYITRHGKKKQRRFLRDSLKNLHKKCMEKTGIQMSYVTFIKFKPFWVVPPKESDRDTCRCEMHTNFDYILKALTQRKILIGIKNRSDLLKKVVCDTNKKLCMLGECAVCAAKKIPDSVIDSKNHINASILYYQWNKKLFPEIISKTGKIAKLTVKEKLRGTQDSLINLLNERLPTFCRHVFVEGHQRKHRECMIKECRVNEVIIHIDWSQNFLGKYEEETQAKHFSPTQISLHTGMIYLKGGEIKIPFCTVSDCPRHDAASIWAHLQPILDFIQNEYPDIDSFHFCSDGPTTQYRNKSNFYLFQKTCIERNVYQATWNFSEAGHGKGAADGVGAVLKRTADSAVIRKKFDVVDAASFIEAVSDVKVKTFIIPREDVEKVDHILPEDLTPIPETMLLRQLTWSKRKPQELGTRMLSCKLCIGTSICEHFKTGTGVYVQQHLISTNPTINVQDQSLPNSPAIINLEDQSLPIPTSDEPRKKTGSIAKSTKSQSRPQSSKSTAVNDDICDEGDWLAVKLNDQILPGQVLQKSGTSLVINLMAKSRDYFIWPPKPNKVSIQDYEYICQLKPPVANRSKRLFVFKERILES